MLVNEKFLDTCFLLLLNQKTTIKRSKDLYRDVLEIITFSNKKDNIDIPIATKNKIELLKVIIDMLIENNKTIENIYDSVMFSEKFNHHQDFLDAMITDEVNPKIFESTIEQIRLRKKIGALFKNYNDLDNVLTSIKDGSFDSIDSLVEDYEASIKILYSNMMESNRSLTIEAAASLDLVKDDYQPVIDMIKNKYDKKSLTSSGFPFFDNYILGGGYEPSRLYIYGGASGSGKSTMLTNSIYKSALIDIPNESRFPKDREIRRVYVYVTLENTIDESILRTYIPMFDIPSQNVALRDHLSAGIMGNHIKEKLLEKNTTIVMKYFPAMSISTVDLMGVLDEVIETYGKETIAGLYVDYIDLLKTDTRYDMYRLELGHITVSLKSLAVQYNIPVITASQLGRGAYRITDSKDLGVDQIAESIKKVEHADYVMLLAKDPITEGLVHGKVGKNRSGRSNIAVDLQVNFEQFKFNSASEARSSENRPDATTKANVSGKDLTFDGLVMM